MTIKNPFFKKVKNINITKIYKVLGLKKKLKKMKIQ